MVSTQTRLGKGLTCIGGWLAVFSFLALPWISLGLFGSYTAMQIALMAGQGSGGSGFQWFLLFWLEFLCAACIAVLSLVAYSKKDREQAISLAILFLAGLGLLGVMGMYSLFSQNSLLFISYTEFIGAGFWCYSVSLALALAGAIVQRMDSSSQSGGTGKTPSF